MRSPVDHDLIVNFGKNIQVARRMAEMTQEKLAELSGISTTYLGSIETGRCGITLTNLRNISRALSISTDLLIFGEVPENDVEFLEEQLRNVSPEAFPAVKEVVEVQVKALARYEAIARKKKNSSETNT